MNEIIIKCPKCHTKIPINEQVASRIKEKLEAENQKDFEKKLEIEKEKIVVEAKKEAEEKAKLNVGAEVKLMREQLEEKTKRLEEAQEAELKIRKEKIQLEESKKVFELEKQRQLDIERKSIEEKAVQKAGEEFRLDLAASKKREEDALKSVAEMKRKMEIGSQQAQGEIQELDIEDLLKAEFPTDEIVAVPKGVNGADCIQKIIDQNGRLVGSIVWESKRTKSWSAGWIAKLKEDQRLVKGDIGIIVSQTLPEGIENFGIQDSVYISSPRNLLTLARILRLNLIKVFNVKSMEAGKGEKKETMYNYLCGPEFKGRIEAVVESTISEKKILDQEKRAFAKIWAAREKQIEKIEMNMLGMYGDLQGIAGQSLPEIKSLDLPTGEEELEAISEKVSVQSKQNKLEIL
jgi:hypothetical protein